MSGNNQLAIDECRIELESIEQFIIANPMDSNCPYLISYSVIRGCGTIEKVLKDIFFQHLTKNANNEAKKYFEKNILESSWNPSCGQIQKILDVINPTWSNQFQTLTNGSKDKMDLKILVTLSCTMCPDLVVAAQQIAAANPNVTAHVYDIRHFEILKNQYNVMSVPCLVVNEEKVSFGKKNMNQILELLK